jgi:hypothetical protein
MPLSDQVLNIQVVHGLSLGFILIFFVPLVLVAVLFFFYCAFARRSVVRVAKVLTLLWLVACIPAGMMILMGYAFNSNSTNPLLILPVWVGLGLVLLWLPVALRVVFRVQPI